MDNHSEKIYEQVVGRRTEILMIMSALQAGKHVFLEGPPGTSKSTILRAISEYTGTQFCLVTGNNDLTTSKLIGYFDPAETLSHGYKPEYFFSGPLLESMQEGQYLYIEEFNRLPDETTNVFVTVMSEKRLNVPRLGLIEAHPDFRIIAALNPLDDIGISRISRALKDRFCSIRMDYQPRNEEIEIVKKRSHVDMDGIIELAVDMARETRTHADIKLGSSVRGSIDMIDIFYETKNAVTPETVGTMDNENLLLNSAIMSFRSKIWIYETSEKTAEEIIQEIFYNLQKKN
ncbi:MAG: MoxR family ATPase [Syntrophaceae bacterium]